MNWDRIRGRWKQLRGAVKERWGRLSHNDLTVIHGRREQLIGRVQQLYGILRDEAAQQVAAFVLQVADAVVEPRRGRIRRIRLVRRRKSVRAGEGRARRRTRG